MRGYISEPLPECGKLAAFSIQIRHDEFNKPPLKVYGAAWPLPVPAIGETVFYEHSDGSYDKPVNAWRVVDVYHFYNDEGGHTAAVMVKGLGPQTASIAELFDR